MKKISISVAFVAVIMIMNFCACSATQNGLNTGVDTDLSRDTAEYTATETDTPDNIEWIKDAYFNYLKSNNLWNAEYGAKTADDLTIEKYVGTYGDACVVAYMGSDGLSWTTALRTEKYGNNKITFPSGQICYAFYKDEVYTIAKAYEKGILTDDDIISIDKIIGIHT